MFGSASLASVVYVGTDELAERAQTPGMRSRGKARDRRGMLSCLVCHVRASWTWLEHGTFLPIHPELRRNVAVMGDDVLPIADVQDFQL